MSIEKDLAVLIVDVLNLDDVSAEEIAPDDTLFGDDGLGLDSIDALEISLAISQQYGVDITARESEESGVFASLRTLGEYIVKNRVAA